MSKLPSLDKIYSYNENGEDELQDCRFVLFDLICQGSQFIVLNFPVSTKRIKKIQSHYTTETVEDGF